MKDDIRKDAREDRQRIPVVQQSSLNSSSTWTAVGAAAATVPQFPFPLDNSISPGRSDEVSLPPNFWGGRGGGGRGGGGDDDGRGPSPTPIDPSITLDTIGGLDDHIKFIRKAVLFPIKHKEALASWGMEPPKGIMFHGPPGTGKTLLAKALANEICTLTNVQVAFFMQKGCESNSMWFGESEQNLRELFEKAVRMKPSFVFFDEIDGKRGALELNAELCVAGLAPNREKAGRSSEAYVTVVTALLGLIDSIKRGDVFIIGATNRLDAVDPALRRPGRFDKELLFPLPDLLGRKRIIQIHTSGWERDQPTGALLEEVAQRAVGYSGADLKCLCDSVVESALRKGRGEGSRITSEDWATAFSQMTPSLSNIYGSTLYVPEIIPNHLRPLLLSNVLGILAKMELLLSRNDFHRRCLPQNGHTKSLLVWDPTNEIGGATLENVMGSVLNHESISSRPIYLLDISAISIKKEETLMGAVFRVIDQLTDFARPAILYILAINHLWETLVRAEEGWETAFISRLKRIRGPNQIIIATWVGELGETGSARLKALFSRRYAHQLSQPSGAEKAAFFNQLFKPEVNGRLQRCNWCQSSFVSGILEKMAHSSTDAVMRSFAKLEQVLQDGSESGIKLKQKLEVLMHSL